MVLNILSTVSFSQESFVYLAKHDYKNSLRTDLTAYHNSNSCSKKFLENFFPKLTYDKVAQDRGEMKEKDFRATNFTCLLYRYCGLYSFTCQLIYKGLCEGEELNLEQRLFSLDQTLGFV